MYYFIPLPQWGFVCFLHTQILLCVINFGSVCLILNHLKSWASDPPSTSAKSLFCLQTFLSYCVALLSLWLIQKPTSAFSAESPLQWSILSPTLAGLSGNNSSYFWVSLNPIWLYFKPVMTSSSL